MRLRLIASPRVPLVALAIALWPVWRWYALRTCDGSDEPCGGVRMLWFGIYLAAALAVFSQLGNRRSLFALIAAVFLVVGANMVRATALFFKEARIVALPDWTHTGVGVVLFAGAIFILVRLTTGRTPWQSAT